MKYTFFYIIALGLFSCQNNKPKAADNLKAVADTSKTVDTKKKSVLNHRY